MIKLLIADDEPLVCVGLRSMLRWEDLGIEIAGTARNGQQALEMIESLGPEIVITDIKMPLKSGLELAEECYRKYGRIPLFIILTSFEEFEFARRALAFQAADYLVKLELTPESLAASIRKALGILEQIRGAAAPARGGGGSRMRALREKFFLRLLNGLFESREECYAQMDDLGLDFSGSALVSLASEIEPPENRQAGDEKLHSLYASAARMVQEKLEKIFRVFVAGMDARHFVAVFCLPQADSARTREILEAELRKTISMIHSYFNVGLRMALGFPVDDPFNLDESYLAARQIFRETRAEEPLLFFERGSCMEARNYMQQVVANMQDYIRRNLDKRLSLHDVAAIFNYSPNYLSQLFAKYAGEGFVEYITAERIRAAKEMLKKGAGPVYEIAEKLGYESAFYFSKVFKKVEGVSPREFLRRLEQGNDSKNMEEL
jgi:two-component system response regulator YesN